MSDYFKFQEGDLEVGLLVALSFIGPLADVSRPVLVVDLRVSKGGHPKHANKAVVALLCREARVAHYSLHRQATEATVTMVRATLQTTLRQWQQERILWTLAEGIEL